MADKKISQLTALAAANLAPSTDVLAIVDTSATETKKIVAQDLINGVLNVASAVGIGTASPTDRLNVGAFSGNNVITIGAATTGTSSVYFGDGTGADRYRGYIDYEHTNDRFVFGTAGTGKAYLDSSGNLGLGVTPSAWQSASGASWDVIDIGGAGALAFSPAGSNDLTLAANAFYDNTDSRWEYKNTGDKAARYSVTAGGTHAWYVTNSTGSANTLISFTQAMTLNASNNLLLGTTSDPGYGRTTASVYNTNGGLIQVAGSATTALFYVYQPDNIAVIGTTTNHPFAFYSNNAERGRFTAGGYFKASSSGTYAGSTGAYHELYKAENNADWTAVVTHAGATAGNQYGIRIDLTGDPNGTGNEFWLCRGNLTTRAAMRSNGGLANYQSYNVDLSDSRTKNSITPAASMWDKIGALEIVTYKYNDQTHDDVNVGVIAQQVESIEPVWVDADGFGETPEGEEPLKTVYTKDITFAAIKALQEAMARIESLEAKVSALEAK